MYTVLHEIHFPDDIAFARPVATRLIPVAGIEVEVARGGEHYVYLPYLYSLSILKKITNAIPYCMYLPHLFLPFPHPVCFSPSLSLSL